MADTSKNVKMMLVLPNNDQESLVNAINYNFHQLANIANGVVAKQGPKGDPGLAGIQGPKGDKGDSGSRMLTYPGDIIGYSEEAYLNWAKENKLTDGDYIIDPNSGIIYKYDEKNKTLDSNQKSVDLQDAVDKAGDRAADGKFVMQSKTYNDDTKILVLPKSESDITSSSESNDIAPVLFSQGISWEIYKDIFENLVNDYDSYSITSARCCNGENIRLYGKDDVSENNDTIIYSIISSNVSALNFGFKKYGESDTTPSPEYNFYGFNYGNRKTANPILKISEKGICFDKTKSNIIELSAGSIKSTIGSTNKKTLQINTQYLNFNVNKNAEFSSENICFNFDYEYNISCSGSNVLQCSYNVSRGEETLSLGGTDTTNININSYNLVKINSEDIQIGDDGYSTLNINIQAKENITVLNNGDSGRIVIGRNLSSSDDYKGIIIENKTYSGITAKGQIIKISPRRDNGAGGEYGYIKIDDVSTTEIKDVNVVINGYNYASTYGMRLSIDGYHSLYYPDLVGNEREYDDILDTYLATEYNKKLYKSFLASIKNNGRTTIAWCTNNKEYAIPYSDGNYQSTNQELYCNRYCLNADIYVTGRQVSIQIIGRYGYTKNGTYTSNVDYLISNNTKVNGFLNIEGLKFYKVLRDSYENSTYTNLSERRKNALIAALTDNDVVWLREHRPGREWRTVLKNNDNDAIYESTAYGRVNCFKGDINFSARQVDTIYNNTNNNWVVDVCAYFHGSKYNNTGNPHLEFYGGISFPLP